MKWKCAGVLLLLFFVQLTSGAAPAQAASVYDDAYKATDVLSVNRAYSGYPGCTNVDLTSNWSSYITNKSTWYPGYGPSHLLSNQIRDSFLDATDGTGSWGVSQNTIYPNDKVVWVYWSEDSQFNLEWYSSGYVYAANVHGIIIDCLNDGQVHMVSDEYTFNEMQYIEVSENEITLGNGSKHRAMSNLFVNTGNVNYPPGYEGEAVQVVQLPATYVAMGDSFSSGEGNPSFEYGTDQGGANENWCHRSLQAYPRRLQNDSSLNLGPAAFVACAGATTSDVTNGKYGEDPQTDVLSADTEVVTVTIGGNDIKFKEFATACVLTNCRDTSSEYQESWDIMTDSGHSDYLPPRLVSVFAAIASGITTANTSAQVYIVGYPKVITQASWTETTSSDPNNCLYMTEASASAAEAIITKLNSTIETAVDAYNDPRFTFVDPTATGSPFIGHELCRSGGYFRGLESAGIFGGNDAYVFHPNENGQLAYKELIADAMS